MSNYPPDERPHAQGPLEDEESQQVRRRAGLLSDERDPDEPPGPPGSAGGGLHAAGAPAGGLAAGGMGGTNVGDGSIDDVRIEDTLGSSEEEQASVDYANDDEEPGPPYSGRSGGAVGGTPAEKRARGGHTGGGIAPGTSHRGDSTIGGDPDRPGGD